MHFGLVVMETKHESFGRIMEFINKIMENYDVLGNIGEGAHGLVLDAVHILTQVCFNFQILKL